MTIQGPFPLSDAGVTASVRPSPPAASPSIRPTQPIGPWQPAASTPGEPAATATVSPWADVLSKLQQHAQSNPSAFERATNDLASAVDARAQKATGADAKALAELSGQLKQAAKSGDLSVFKPTHHVHRVKTESPGSQPTLLQELLAQIDHVLGPGATPP
ncbi:MAG: hypothetical protein WBY94_01250 [Polyangiaceae bacterium]